MRPSGQLSEEAEMKRPTFESIRPDDKPKSEAKQTMDLLISACKQHGIMLIADQGRGEIQVWRKGIKQASVFMIV